MSEPPTMRASSSGLTILLLVVTWLGLTTPAVALNFLARRWGNVIVVTEMTPEGRAIEPATPDKPVYYRGRSLGCRFGSIPGDQLPEVEEMNQVVAKVLAKQGYLGARPGVDEPSLFVVIQWGYLRPSSGELLWFLGYDPSQDIAAPSMPGLLGPEVYRRGLRSRTIQTILDSASDPIYGIIVTAFDYATADTPEPVIYWQTRIGLPANGKSMSQALPLMAVAAGPTIGRETKFPMLRDVDDLRQGRVELGELEVTDVID